MIADVMEMTGPSGQERPPHGLQKSGRIFWSFWWKNDRQSFGTGKSPGSTCKGRMVTDRR